MERIAVTCENVSKSFGATRAVVDIGFSLRDGEILALVGENGAGKSTLMNLLSGALSPDTGEITIAESTAGRRRSVAMVHQELSLFDNLTVGENLELGRPSGGAFVEERASRAASLEVIDTLGIDVSIDARVGNLSVGQRQLVEVAKAVAVAPRLLILDEPTSSLESPQVALLFATVRRLSALGTAVIFVSHRMDELFELCDRVLVMRDGGQVEFGPLERHTSKSLVASMVGRESSTLYPDRPDLQGADEVAEIELRSVTLAGHLHDISLALHSGRITAVAGLEGHGQSEIAELLAGARRPTTGDLVVCGRAETFRSPRAAVRRGIGYVPPDRRLDGLLLDKSVWANVILAASPRLSTFAVYNARKERWAVTKLVKRLAVKASSVHQSVIELSGGNQQKVLVGRWLTYPGLRVLVLNDPTRGVDVGSRAQIYRVVRELAKSGVAVVLVSTDMQEILGLSDDIYVVYSGRVTGYLVASEATENAIMRHAMGVDDNV